MKYLLVTGGVISGIGKGIVSSSIGAIMKANGWVVTCRKIDPYLNIDAGTFSPYQHGEVYVLDDGGEVDLDLGNYERYINVTLTKDHNITTGKIYQHVTQRERRGEYLGKTVQVSIRELRARGLQADILFCRCNSELSPHVIEKLGLFCQVPTDRVGSDI
ncbi:unnamed protein product [Hymenolepis diminuta]|uniref:CTP_synth_N domain-containing protein n=1 Tax=Hymenolepis diminuta TaxID=6216 RepID=A0A0R3SW77_HYMDI|nr:unnamed protein product [Hymenolepis diminuta]